jgi:hypothetical protein
LTLRVVPVFWPRFLAEVSAAREAVTVASQQLKKLAKSTAARLVQHYAQEQLTTNQ